jgi:predicted ATPase
MLHLEPSALRRPDEGHAPTIMDPDGAHLPATLYRIATRNNAARVYAEVANRLSELVEGVRKIHVDRDESRDLLRLMMTDQSDVTLPASSLSDGTLRFLALVVLEKDPTNTGLICLEEPENGIHPGHLHAVLALLEDIAMDPNQPIDDENPLRQVIVSTHSPVAAAHARSADLVFAAKRDTAHHLQGLTVRAIENTWRNGGKADAATKGEIIGYLGSLQPGQPAEETVYHYVANQLALPFGSRE